MTFTLDTSGYVQCPATDQKPNESTGCRFWSDLTPFAQGYVEALFSGAVAPQTMWPCRFQDLAPETLARIITDCASFENIAAGLGQKTGALEGRHFWNGQQRGLGGAFGAAFPALTVTIGTAGKVRLA